MFNQNKQINHLDGALSEDDILRVFSESKPKIIVCDSEAIPEIANGSEIANDIEVSSELPQLQVCKKKIISGAILSAGAESRKKISETNNRSC